MRIIDSDGHVTTDNSQELAKHLDVPGLAERFPPGAGGRAFFPPLDHLHSMGHRSQAGSFRQASAEDWLEFMDEVGIETAVLYPTAGLAVGQMMNAEWAAAVTHAYNDWLVERFTSRTPRLKGMGLLPLQDPRAAVRELRRAVEELGLCGVMLPSNGLPTHLGAPHYWPVYEEANALGCPIAVHGGCHGGLGLDTLNAFTPVHALGHPFGLMVSFAGIVFNGLLDRFPNLRWAFLEGGVGWFSLCLERFDRSASAFSDFDPGGRLLRLGENERVSDYLIRHAQQGRLYIGAEGMERNLAHLVRTVGSQCVLYSSDFPHEVNPHACREEIAEILHHPDLSQEDREAILHRNAERFYGIAAEPGR